MEEKDDESLSIINNDSRPLQINQELSNNNNSFSISPKELSNLMNLYKDRSENYNDIKYFQEKGGIVPLLTSLKTDAKHGISKSSVENRIEHFGENKIFVRPLPNF